jgi:lipid A ethanolaminephosphotransferase
VAQTNTAEAITYVNWAVFAWLFFLGVIPSALLMRTEIVYPPLKQAAIGKTLTALGALLVIGAIAGLYFKDYASVIRNNPMVRKQPVPIYAINSAYGYVKKTYFTKAIPYRILSPDATLPNPGARGKKKLVVLVVGETQRSMNYELNGYGRPTNTYTRKLGIISYPHTASCGTATATSVPCMFSNLTRENYSKEMAESQDTFLDIAKRAGVHVLWLDNDSGCKDVCKNVETIDLRAKYINDKNFCGIEGCYDNVFVKEFTEQYDKLPDVTSLVVLHIMGSHGPTYYQRYTDADRVFKPDCPRSDIQNCGHDELINTYDNTILYSDHVMADIIGILQKNADKRDATLIFMSDHGESLGEKGVYLHGLPYAIAPKEQTSVPFLLWMSDGFAANRGLNLECLRGQLTEKSYSHDNLFHTVLGLLDVKADTYRKDMDAFAACQTAPHAEK